MGTRKKYSEEFRAGALKLVRSQPEKTVKEIAEELGVPQTVLNNWVRRAGGRAEPAAKRGPSVDAPEARRIRELEKELERVKTERDFLKKAAAFFAKYEN
jgi:transposase